MRHLLLWMFVLTAPLGLSAQPVEQLTAASAVNRALQNNDQLRAARQKPIAARAIYEEYRTDRLPTLRATGQYLRKSPIPEFDIPLPTSIPDQDAITIAPSILNQYAAALRLEQPLFTGFQLTNRIQAARHEQTAAEFEVEQRRSDLRLQVQRAYWQLSKTLAVEEVIAKSLQQIEAQLRDARSRQAAGRALTSEVLAFQTRRSEIRLEQLDARNAVRIARLSLNELMGLPLDTKLIPTDTVRIDSSGRMTDDLAQRAVRQRSDVHMLLSTIDALDDQVEMARGGWFPQINLIGSYYYARPNSNIFPLEDKFQGTWEVGVSASFDLWNWGRTSHQTRRVQSQLRRSEAELESLETSVRASVQRHLLEVERAAEAIRVVEQHAAEARESFRVVRQQFRQGTALMADVLAAETAHRNAEMQRAHARADYAIARAALRHAVGQSITR